MVRPLMPNKKTHKDKKKRRLSRRHADKYVLYSKSVQDTSSEIAFIERIYRRYNDTRPKILREDFCSTAILCCDWISGEKDRRAIGVDIDPDPLKWTEKHLLHKMSKSQLKRLEFLKADVLYAECTPADVIAALNFSYCVFKDRKTLLHYIKRCYDGLADGGALVMDLYGGPESQKPQKDRHRNKGFTYIWDQHSYNPVTSEVTNFIHFRFPDGTMMKNAFRYDWRLWTLREITDLMTEAGFRTPTVYWEDADEDGDGNGVFRPRKVVEVEDAWVSYIVGWKT